MARKRKKKNDDQEDDGMPEGIGPCTRFGHNLFNGVGSATYGAGNMLVEGAGRAVTLGAAGAAAGASAGRSMLDAGYNFNEYAQEEFARFDHEEQRGDEWRPFTTHENEE